MRISTLKHDAGYQPPAVTNKTQVAFNGELMNDAWCVIADEAGGYIVVIDRNEEGTPIIDVDLEMKHRAKFGRVEIKMPKEAKRVVDWRGGSWTEH